MSAAAMALRSGAVFTAAFMTRIPDVTLSITRLVPMEVIERPLSTLRIRSVVTVARIIAIIYVAVKAAAAMKPGAGSNE